MLTVSSFPFPFPIIFVFTITLPSPLRIVYHVFYYFVLYLVISLSCVIMSRNANGANINSAVPPSGVEEALQVADAHASTDSRVTDIDIDCGVASSLVAE